MTFYQINGARVSKKFYSKVIVHFMKNKIDYDQIKRRTAGNNTVWKMYVDYGDLIRLFSKLIEKVA